MCFDCTLAVAPTTQLKRSGTPVWSNPRIHTTMLSFRVGRCVFFETSPSRTSNPAVPVVSCYRIQAPPDSVGIFQVFTTRRALSVQLLLPLHCVEATTVERTHNPSLEAVVATAKRKEMLEILQGLYGCVAVLQNCVACHGKAIQNGLSLIY